MRFKLLFAMTAMASIAADKADGDKTDAEKFAGTWTAVAIERDGKPVPADDLAKVKLVVKGAGYTLETGHQTIAGTHKLDPKQTPKTIDAVRSEGPDKGKTIRGIYELTGDSYKVCFGEPDGKRPTEFKTAPGLGQRMLTFKRASSDR